MSEQLHFCVGSSAASSGPRSIAKAFLILLCVHAALVGMLWQVISNQRQPTSRQVRVELSSAAHPTTAVASARVPPESKLDSSERKIKVRSDQIVRAHAPVEQAAARLPGLAVSDTSPSGPARETELSPEAEAQQPQQGALPIDLRVLDWLARYRTYPLAARRARIEGVVQLRVTLMPDGRLVGARVEHSSGHPMLDQAALDLLTRAAPLPSEFGSTRTEQVELQLPIVYHMRTSST
jgi:protein TonB